VPRSGSACPSVVPPATNVSFTAVPNPVRLSEENFAGGELEVPLTPLLLR
jgi:hypothetical protein